MAGPLVNPYEDVDWGTVTRHVGVTHMHSHESGSGSDQVSMDRWYAAGPGVRVMSWSNYFPETPVNPAVFTSIPGDVILVDNSEQHHCTDTELHFCPIGTTYSNDGGTGVPWRQAFDDALALLEHADGGGITINHPQWTALDNDVICQMLDHDPRVLGIEAYNHMCVTNYPPPKSLSAIPKWDAVLGTGRRCWGFWAHDHYLPELEPYLGYNMLLLNEPGSAAAACRAYRDGRFYGAMVGTGLVLTGVSVADHSVTVTTDSATTISMVTNVGTVVQSGPASTFVVPGAAAYARFEATNAADTIYTQPLMYLDEVIDVGKRRRHRFIMGMN